MNPYCIAVSILLLCLPKSLYSQEVHDISDGVKSKLEEKLKKAQFEQPLTKFRDYTGKTLGVKSGWELKARGKASIEKVEKLSVKVFKIDYAEVKLPDGTVKKAYSDFSGNVELEVRWKSSSRGEKWIVAGSAKTLGDVLWGNLNPKGKATLKVEVTKSGAKVNIKFKDLVVEPDSDSRAAEFATERLIEPKLKQLVLKELKEVGIEAAK